MIALEDSDTNSALVAKALEVKEPRFAQAAAVQEALGSLPADGRSICSFWFTAAEPSALTYGRLCGIALHVFVLLNEN